MEKGRLAVLRPSAFVFVMLQHFFVKLRQVMFCVVIIQKYICLAFCKHGFKRIFRVKDFNESFKTYFAHDSVSAYVICLFRTNGRTIKSVIC